MNRGRKPFGTDQDEREIVDKIKLMARRVKGGRKPSLLSIANELNANGVGTRTGRHWNAVQVKRVLEYDWDAAPKPVIRVKKTGLATEDYLTKQELAKVFAACKDLRETMIVAVLSGAGLRASELCALQVGDLGVTGGKAQVDVRRGKGAKQRCVLISNQLAGELARYVQSQGLDRWVFPAKRGNRMSYRQLYEMIKAIGRRCGLLRLHPHSLRHTFGTLLYHYQKDLFFVKEQLGHNSVDTTQIYAKTLTQSKLEQMSSFGSDIGAMLQTNGVGYSSSKMQKPTQTPENKGTYKRK